ncbi:MAG: glycosyltransferase [Crocinitomicaceae bacterium]
MKVLHYAYSVSKQSASYRIHRGLVNNGVQSSLIVAAKSINEKSIIKPRSITEKLTALLPLLTELFLKKVFKISEKAYFSINKYQSALQQKWFSYSRSVTRDITHLHWVGNGFVSLLGLSKISGPIVITLHDMWFLTGGCHVNLECHNYQYGCETCPRLGNKILGRNLTKNHFRNKSKFFQNGDIEIIVLSSWMQDLALKSPMLKGIKIHLVPNGIDLNVFKPHNITEARLLFNLPKNDSLILFGGISALVDYNKGFDLLERALKSFRGDRGNLKLITFGSENVELSNIDGIPIINIGVLRDEVSLSALYSAVNLVVVPSRQESFSQISAEAISCGTPVVAFDHSGPRDIINHKENGFLATPYEVQELTDGIEWLLKQDLRESCRQIAIERFDIDKIAKKHIEIYQKLMS